MCYLKDRGTLMEALGRFSEWMTKRQVA
jgi:hypothetical protein